VPVTALVLRNYGCNRSKKAAVFLSQALQCDKYGKIEVDLNNRDEALNGKDENGVDRWYRYIQKRISEVDFVILMLSNNINDAEPEVSSGTGLLSEALSFCSLHDKERTKKLIFVCIDCSVDDLRQPRGCFEQLQDIIMPLAKETGVIRLESDTLCMGKAARNKFADQVAAKMGWVS